VKYANWDSHQLSKRILLVNTRHFLGGGDSTYTFNLAKILRDHGHQVAFFAMQGAKNLPDANSDLFVSEIDYRTLIREGSMASRAKAVARGVYSVQARHQFSQMLGRFTPDVIHLQNIHAHITPSVILEAKKRGLPVLWTLHDYKLICPNSHFLIDDTGQICEACGRAAYYQASLRRCKKGSFLASSMAGLEAVVHRLMRVRNLVDAFLAPSAFLKRLFIDRGFPAARMYHLPYVLPNDLLVTTVHDGDYVLFLGKLEQLKGISYLIEASRLTPNVKLVLAGRVEEPIASRLPTLLPPNAAYVGMKHGDELRGLLHGAMAVVLPSIWYENQPFSILEAFAAGKPVIASDLGGMAELIAGGERGLLAPPGNVEALASAMLWMSTHRVEAVEMGRRARQYAIEQHGPERHYRQLMSIYSTVSEQNYHGPAHS
jgi:glycosyltransferase involved in cell wall biosynthesis